MIQYEAFGSMLALFLLVLFVRGPWRDVCTDYARQVMFECRDAIYDLAAGGALSFESDAYTGVRLGIERNIRFAHELSIGRLVVFSPRLGQMRGPSPFDIALASIDDDAVREQVAVHVRRSQRALLTMMVVKSPLLLLFGAFVAVLSAVSRRVLAKRREVVDNITRVIQAEADNTPANGNSARAA